jgi:hypothetical protein
LNAYQNLPVGDCRNAKLAFISIRWPAFRTHKIKKMTKPWGRQKYEKNWLIEGNAG